MGEETVAIAKTAH